MTAYRILKSYRDNTPRYDVFPYQFSTKYIGCKGWYFSKGFADFVCSIKNNIVNIIK